MRLKPNHAALSNATTIHLHALRQPDEINQILKPVSNNGKLGKGFTHVSKGRWAGMPMYGLTLHERATCPSSCKQWDNCFGNNMAFAHRVDHRHSEFRQRVEDELHNLTRKHKQGLLLRLHILGDFVDEDYVLWWRSIQAQYPRVHVFGYTAHTPDSPTGKRIDEWNNATDKTWIRFSNAGDNPDVLVANVETHSTVGIPCPEQTGKTESCLTCALCWTTEKPILFREH